MAVDRDLKFWRVFWDGVSEPRMTLAVFTSVNVVMTALHCCLLLTPLRVVFLVANFYTLGAFTLLVYPEMFLLLVLAVKPSPRISYGVKLVFSQMVASALTVIAAIPLLHPCSDCCAVGALQCDLEIVSDHALFYHVFSYTSASIHSFVARPLFFLFFIPSSVYTLVLVLRVWKHSRADE